MKPLVITVFSLLFLMINSLSASNRIVLVEEFSASN
jgi:hypothetical protein